ncbi:BTAD domain-containing putative transcriptional regulator [Streptomyces sp. NPDC101206]|uniref:AfsR/SARP family transcriptional regulator n=1 Tax=Streptomyces sp. NPDC101206 TaxID=3366128 RepID=UPI00381FA0C4
MHWDPPESSCLEFRLLGPVELYDHRSGTRTVPSGAKQRALFAALAVRGGEVLSTERLIDELWGERPPANAANALQAHVARLRRLLPRAGGDGPARALIATHPLGYRLRTGSASTDVQRFHRLCEQGRAVVVADPAHAVELLHRALELWRGPALDGSGRGHVCAREAERLEQGRLTALEAYHEAGLRSGRHAEACEELERLTAAHPTRERFHDLLMLALYRCGRPAEALGVYERARQRLLTEVGVGPGPALRARMEAILCRDPELDLPWPAGPAGSTGAASAPGAATPVDLGGEIARLRERIGVLGREQEELARRLAVLSDAFAASGSTAAPVSPVVFPAPAAH